MPASPISEYSWHSLSIQEALKALRSSEQGLTNPEAAARLKSHGKNLVSTAPPVSAVKRFLLQFRNPLIYILLASGFITAFMQHWTDTGVIAAVILLNALIGFIQEQKAENALAAIRQLLSSHASVLRDGSSRLIPAEELVPGDIVTLTAGDKVPADLRLLSSFNLRTQEAILTGESLDVEKSTDSQAETAGLAERSCMAYSGTLVTAGQGSGVVIATGASTQIGSIGSMLGGMESPDTPLTLKLTKLSTKLAILIVIISLLVFIYGVLIRGLPVSEMFMVMIAIAVSTIPEGLPAIISISLAVGVRAMARRNAIVRHLPVIESLGSASVICTDKTGTLTRNELAVTDIVTAERTFSVSGAGYSPEGKIFLEQKEIQITEHPTVSDMGGAAMLNNDATLKQHEGTWTLAGDPTEGALMAFALKAGHEHQSIQTTWPRTDVIPFSAEERYMATLHQGKDGEGLIFVKGAPERLLKMCSAEQTADGSDRPLDMQYWLAQVDILARQGKRVLAIAHKHTPETYTSLHHEDIKDDLCLFGLFGIMDTPREEAKPAIAACMKAGIAVKMITGDHALTASSIGAALGIINPEKVLTGSEMEKLSDADLSNMVESVNIYARMQPEHKLKLVKALQAKGEVVAMTGDGVNDAPALKMADIGIAMGKQGTEVAKEASAIVLTDDNFASIVHAVEEGRNVYRNIRRTIQFMLVTDGCEGLILLIAMLMAFTLPITPLQILWVNMVTSVTLSLAFAFAPYDPEVMQRRPMKLGAPIFSRAGIIAYLFHMLVITGGTIGLFLHEIQNGTDIETARTIAVNVLVCFQIYYLWGLLLGQKKSDNGIRAYLPLIASTLAIIVFEAFFTYLPWMQGIFSTTSLTVHNWLKINLVAVIIFVWVWGEYRLFGRR